MVKRKRKTWLKEREKHLGYQINYVNLEGYFERMFDWLSRIFQPEGICQNVSRFRFMPQITSSRKLESSGEIYVKN